MHFLQALDHVDEVAVTGRRVRGVARESGDDAFSVIADLARAGGVFLRFVVGEMREVAAHQTSRLLAVAGAGIFVELGNLLQTAEAHGGGEGRDDRDRSRADRQARSTAARTTRRRPGSGAARACGVMPTLSNWKCLPWCEIGASLAHRRRTSSMPSSKIDWLSSKFDVEGQVLAAVIAAAGGEIDAASAEQIERRPLFGDADGMMQRQHGDGGGEADAGGARGDVGEDQVRAGEHAERAEVMLADPGGVDPDFVGIDRFIEDVGDELVRAAAGC